VSETIYIDSEFKCHTSNDGTMTPVNTDFFDGKYTEFVEGHCFDTSKGYEQIYPWKPYSELDAAQREYERQKLADAENALVEYESALAELDALVLNLQYNNLIK
jgi:hypothetical protein